MITDSAPWKDQLLKDADLIERWSVKPQATERRSILIEKKVFLSAYAMRKLFEAEKLSSDLNGHSVKAERFDLFPDRKLTWWKTHRADEVFDLSMPRARTVAARDLLDTIIHSKIFSECVYDEDDFRVSGFFVTSDKRDAHIWLVPIDSFTSLMRLIGKDYPSNVTTVFDDDGTHYSWRGHGEPPVQVTKKMETIIGNRLKRS